MKRHEMRERDGTLEIERAEGWMTVGELDEIVDIVGDETYTIEYDDEASSVPWLSTGEDNTISFEVRETVVSMTHPTEFVEELADRPLDGDPHPERTEFFADFMVRVWESKGQLDDDDPAVTVE